VKTKKTFLVLNSNDKSGVRLILPPPSICGGTNCTAKTWSLL